MTLGTRGDVQPYLALAKELISLGNKAVICTSESFKNLIENEGVEFCKATLDLMAIASTDDGKAVLENPIKNMKLAIKMSKEIISPRYRQTFDDFYSAATDCDVIVYHPKAFVAVDIAIKLSIPCISMPPVPITYPITEFPCIAISPAKNFGAFFNRLTYSFNSKAESGYINQINDFRTNTLKLTSRKAGQYTYFANDKEIPIIYPISKYLFNDVKSWNNHVTLTGFFFLDTNENLDNDLEIFLSKGKKPISISFSSMPVKNPDDFTKKLHKALKETSNRAVLLVGNSGIDIKNDETIFVVKQAPHTKLFPRSKAVIHHGGAGTTATALLLVPFATDQLFWAQRVYKKGVSLEPFKEADLTWQKLSKAFLSFEDKDIIEKANEMSVKVKKENGLQNAAEFIMSVKCI